MTDSSRQDPPQSAPPATYLKDYRPPAFLVDDIKLVFELDPARTRVSSLMNVRRNPQAEDMAAPLELDGAGLELVSVVLNGQSLSEDAFHIEDERLSIPQVPDAFEIELVNYIAPEQNTALEGLYVSGSMLCTQCEAEGFRHITYFPDRPDVMSRYDVTLIAHRENYPVLLSNGNLTEQGDYADGRHWTRWVDPSLKPCYLFALVAGDLEFIEDRFTTCSGREVVLRLYTEAENIHKCDHAMASLKKAMAWDEQVYGREYELDVYMIVAVEHFNMGAMENKGLNIFNASYVLASSETATDQDYANIEGVIGHEYFHNWSGNRVTCRDWFQLSLKEGFTVFRDQEFSADMNSRAVVRIDDVNILRSYQFAEDAGPMAHPVRPDHYIEISNFYTLTVYNKGAEVVRMISNLLGAERFRKGTDLYFERHDGQAVTTDDFLRAMEDANGVDLTQFRRWYEQAGTPELTVSDDYDAAARSYRLHIRQSCPPTPGQQTKAPFHIPVAVGLLDRKGRDLIGTRVLELTRAEQTYAFGDLDDKPVPSLLRGFSAPVKIHFERDDADLAFLLAHDSDDFNRWEAGQQLAINILKRLVAIVRSGGSPQLDSAFIGALSTALHDADIDKALLARILNLPTQQYLADQFEQIDVDAIYEARLTARRQIAAALREPLLQTYEALHTDAPYHFDDAAMARRSLKNCCLGYLMELNESRMHALCHAQFQGADNMTDQMAALSALAQHDIPERRQALDAFYERWQDDPLVVNKWLAVQASSRLSDTLAVVKGLLTHPAFDAGNPNRIRALIGQFCQQNAVRFHASDGSGYAFLTDQVLNLNRTNPSIAARLLQAISRWRRYDEHRQRLMQAELERILAEPQLSKDVYEIATRSLGRD